MAGPFDNMRLQPDRPLAIERYDALARRYDASCRGIEAIRSATIDHLGLVPGDTVFDVCCGTGAALPELVQRVGRTGYVVGIEQSPEMLARARARFGGEGPPQNVELIESPVEEATPSRTADALLFCYTHDVLQLPAALDRLTGFARPGARVAVLGLRLLPWSWGAPINLWKLLAGRQYVTTWRGLRAPWTHLARCAPDLRIVGHYHLGTTYLAVGTIRP